MCVSAGPVSCRRPLCGGSRSASCSGRCPPRRRSRPWATRSSPRSRTSSPPTLWSPLWACRAASTWATPVPDLGGPHQGQRLQGQAEFAAARPCLGQPSREQRGVGVAAGERRRPPAGPGPESDVTRRWRCDDTVPGSGGDDRAAAAEDDGRAGSAGRHPQVGGEKAQTDYLYVYLRLPKIHPETIQSLGRARAGSLVCLS